MNIVFFYSSAQTDTLKYVLQNWPILSPFYKKWLLFSWRVISGTESAWFKMFNGTLRLKAVRSQLNANF